MGFYFEISLFFNDKLLLHLESYLSTLKENYFQLFFLFVLDQCGLYFTNLSLLVVITNYFHFLVMIHNKLGK